MRLGNMAARKTLLFLSSDSFHACTWKGGRLSGMQRFTDNPEGREHFAIYLQAHRDPALLLTDLVEEDFRLETVPHLRGGERAALIRRKFEQYHRNTPFRQALPLRRRTSGRRDDDMLFSALTNPALISPWLDIMLAHNMPLVGIYSVPNISAPLVRNIPSSHLLLLSMEEQAGLRQTYFDDGFLRFSRLTPSGSENSFGETIEMESGRTLQYLKSLSLLPPGAVLDVYIICHAKDRRELEVRLNGDTGIHYTCLDIQELGCKVKSKTAYAESDATPLFLHLLAARPPHSHYASPEHTHFFRLRKIRHTLFGLSVLLAVVSLLWGVANIMEGRGLAAESELVRMQAGALSQQRQLITRDFPATLVSATDMKTAVLLSRKLGSYFPPPQELLDGLGVVMDVFPRIRVDRLSWGIGVEPDVPAQAILLDGELAEFSGDYRGALDYLERFRQALSQSGHAVTVLKLPLDISPAGSIAADGDSKTEPAQFSLKIIRKLAA